LPYSPAHDFVAQAQSSPQSAFSNLPLHLLKLRHVTQSLNPLSIALLLC